MILRGNSRVRTRMMTCLTFALVVGFSLRAAPSALAHPQWMRFVRHRVTISVGRRNLDITVELTVGEIPSQDERRMMDIDQDGVVKNDEVARYLQEKREVLRRSVGLTVSGQPVELMFLYEPEIDLLGDRRAAESQLILRLFYFARTPPWLCAGDDMVIADRLWSFAPAIGSYHVTCQDGMKVIADRDASVLWSPSREAGPLVMCARCVAAPGDLRSAPPARATTRASERIDAKDLPQNHPSNRGARRVPAACSAVWGTILSAGAAVFLRRRAPRLRIREKT